MTNSTSHLPPQSHEHSQIETGRGVNTQDSLLPSAWNNHPAGKAASFSMWGRAQSSERLRGLPGVMRLLDSRATFTPIGLVPERILLPLFAHEDSEAQRGQATYSRSHCWWGAESECEESMPWLVQTASLGPSTPS